MKPILDLNEDIREQIQQIENRCDQICKAVRTNYKDEFERHGSKLIVELVRKDSQNSASSSDQFTKDYQSYIEIGIEKSSDFYPTATFTIWKCKEELFHKVGYLTECPLQKIQIYIEKVIDDILYDLKTRT